MYVGEMPIDELIQYPIYIVAEENVGSSKTFFSNGQVS
jgi:hypothetical protein